MIKHIHRKYPEDVNYEAWADLHKPQSFKNERVQGLYIGERDWVMNKDYVFYVLALFMLAILSAMYFGG